MAIMTAWIMSASHWSTSDQAIPSVRLKKANRMAQANEMKVKPCAMLRHSAVICSNTPNQTKGHAENKRHCEALAVLMDCWRWSSVMPGKNAGPLVLSK